MPTPNECYMTSFVRSDARLFLQLSFSSVKVASAHINQSKVNERQPEVIH